MPHRKDIWATLRPANDFGLNIIGKSDAEIEQIAAELIRRGDVAKLARILADQRDSSETLYQEANVDALTGVFNRQAFGKFLQKKVNEVQHRGGDLALAYIDLNDFKKINDTYGHAAGDAALAAVGNLLKNHVRGADVAVRMAGDEFAVLLAKASPDEAKMVTDRLREEFAALHIEWDGARVPVNASVGVASFTPGMDAETFVIAADDAMYREKQKKNAARDAAQSQHALAVI